LSHKHENAIQTQILPFPFTYFSQEAIDMLLDPLISMDDLKPWQHQCIIRAFLYQGQHQMALKYIRVQQPPLKDIEDIRLVSAEYIKSG
jgi:hypothetical protein